MGRKSRVISISVPQSVAQELDRMSEEEGISKSEFVRLMVRSYKREQAEFRFRDLQRRTAPKARAKSIFTEEDVDRLVFEDR